MSVRSVGMLMHSVEQGRPPEVIGARARKFQMPLSLELQFRIQLKETHHWTGEVEASQAAW